MKVLVIEPNRALARLWARHLERQGAEVEVLSGQREAVARIRDVDVDVIVVNLVLQEGSAFAVADYAAFVRPGAKVVFVTNSTFFSDGSIFRHVPNACGFLPQATAPEDLAAMVEHWGAPHAAAAAAARIPRPS